MDNLENFWKKLFSCDKSLIEIAWKMLDSGQRKDVRDQLCRMVMEEGWHKEQVDSAQAALDVIDRMQWEANEENGK